ncbi:YbaK/EbsC family protein [Peptococcus simiae]|uniref:YbaK/EbsC family protein n=1 Tax=Peptococcus simiae TaxID=1643805 RepID=A0ABW9GYD2_9FIRM
MTTGFDRASGYLTEKGYADRIQVFTESTATVALAAQQVGCEEALIAKSLSFYDQDGGSIVIVAAGDAKVDNKGFKEQFGFKAKMLRGEDVEALTGYQPGGVCPFALPETASVYLDASLNRFEMVYPACGDAASAVGLTIPELAEVSGALATVDVCKGWREEA